MYSACLEEGCSESLACGQHVVKPHFTDVLVALKPLFESSVEETVRSGRPGPPPNPYLRERPPAGLAAAARNV
jgi:hypothetical protein